MAVTEEGSSWSKARKIGMLEVNMLNRQLHTTNKYRMEIVLKEYLPTRKCKYPSTSFAIRQRGCY